MPQPITAPAGYYPPFALAFADADGNGVVVDTANPLPVAAAAAPPEPGPPLSGTTSAGGVLGPFAPVAGPAIWLSLAGTWSGTVTVQRSLDGGATRLPLTVGGLPWARFSRNVCEPVAEEAIEGARYYLDVALAAGTLAYRLGQ